MKRCISLSFLLLALLITACAPGGKAACPDALCITMQRIGPLKVGASVPIEVRFQAARDSNVMIDFITDPGVLIEDMEDKTSPPDRNKVMVQWQKQVKAGVETKIVQNVRFIEPGNFTVWVLANSRDGIAKDAIQFTITENGATELPPVNPDPATGP